MQLRRNTFHELYAWAQDAVKEWGWDRSDKFIAVFEWRGNRITAYEGDYITKQANGEFLPCDPEIFAALYQAVPDGSEINIQ